MVNVDWQLFANGENITAKVKPLLLSLDVIDDVKDDSDQLSLQLALDERLKIPPRGTFLTLKVAGITLGNYLVDTRNLSLPGQVLRLEASGTPFNENPEKSPLQTQRSRKWPESTTLKAVAESIAKASGLVAKLSPKLEAVTLKGVTQKQESDLNLLQRLSRENAAYFKINQGTLLLNHYDDPQTASGQTLPTQAFTYGEMMALDWSDDGRSEIKRVNATFRPPNEKTAKRETVSAGSEDPTMTLKQTFASKAQAFRAAQAELTRQQNKSQHLSFSLPEPRFDIFALHRVKVTGAPPEISEQTWKIVRVSHHLNQSGWTTSIHCEGA